MSHLRQLVQDTPNYVQMACHHLVLLGHKHIGSADVETTLDAVVRQHTYGYQTLLNTLTVPQQRALRLAAYQSQQVYAKELLARFEIPSGAALASAMKAPKSKGILDAEATHRGSVVFDDPLLAIWLRSE